jgi:hypothetical protein
MNPKPGNSDAKDVKPLIFSAFYAPISNFIPSIPVITLSRELELIEQWGSGIPGIFRQAAAQNLAEPLTEEIAGRIRFTVILPEILPLTDH